MKRYRTQHEHNAEAALMRDGAKYFREAFPNPDRIGCPASAALEVLADRDRAVTDHLTCCSPCFIEYEALVHRRRSRQRVRVFAAAAAVVLLAATMWLAGQWRHTAPTGQRPDVAKTRPSPPSDPAPEVAVLDFRNEHRYRGENRPPQSRVNRPKYQLPPRRLALTIYLPVGNEEGGYEIEVLNNSGTAVVSRNVEGQLRNHVLTIQLDLDLRSIPAGQYTFRLGRNGIHLEEYPLAITSPAG